MARKNEEDEIENTENVERHAAVKLCTVKDAMKKKLQRRKRDRETTKKTLARTLSHEGHVYTSPVTHSEGDCKMAREAAELVDVAILESKDRKERRTRRRRAQ